ncbi:putative leucine zipper transcription factor-like protein 1 isoform X2 [Penaeus vannamei]|uniref:Putative leucine zipper transcription factor-like protein 1 isoform X2 n=1 Tax=Penaeus vannamei TaxID=6689 RepID=A0A3R7SPU6_PENVA|nr:putative leucine zipper transcription factor-like protein 1 isoform X2 [Penaeus vannamei]
MSLRERFLWVILATYCLASHAQETPAADPSAAAPSANDLTKGSGSEAKPADAVSVVSFQASRAASTNSSLVFRPPFPQVSAITFCAWLRFRHFTPFNDRVASYFTEWDEDLAIWNDWINKEFVLNVLDLRLKLNFTVPLYTWTHIFASVDALTLEHHFLVNNQDVPGKLVLGSEKKPLRPIAAGGLMVLGQDQDSPGGGYAVTQAFSGDMAELLLFDKLFTKKDTKETFNCYENVLGGEEPLLSTNRLEQWDFVGDVEVFDVPRDHLDPTQKNNFFILPERRYFVDSLKLCTILGLPMAVPKSESENEELFQMAVEVESICLSAYSTNVWIGGFGNLTNKQWERTDNKEPLEYQYFDASYALVTEEFQCISMGSSLYPLFWYSTACSKQTPCTACDNNPVNSIKVRGLCKESHFDRELHIHDTVNLKPIFHGTYYSKLWWDNTTWVMASRLLPDLEARMIINDPEDYPIGLRQWRITGDECPAGEVDLLLTVCGEESFPCNDGTCVHMSQRCDLRAHCDDGSDEMKCDKVFVGTDYEKTLPPPPPETEDVLNVTLSVIITAVRTLNLLDQAVTLDVQLMSQWEDSRLKYADLQPEQYRNQVQDADRLWQPELITMDDTGSRVDVVTRGSSLVVIRDAPPLPSDDTRVTKAVVFPGLGNPLLLRQELSITFQCQFDLRWFPFDNQKCSLSFRLNDVESKLVSMIASKTIYLGPEKLPEYKVRRVTLRKLEESDGQELTVVFTNLFLYYLANSYLPSFLLVVISYSTFYFRLEDFNERIMVSITAMLVLVALFQQTSSTILKTTYLKLIDVWYMNKDKIKVPLECSCWHWATARNILRYGIYMSEQSEDDRRNYPVDQLVGDIYPALTGQWNKANALFKPPVLNGKVAITPKLKVVWHQAVMFSFGKGKLDAKEWFMVKLDELFYLICVITNCGEEGCEGCVNQAHINCFCSREKKIPVKELAYIKGQEEKVGSIGPYQMGGPDLSEHKRRRRQWIGRRWKVRQSKGNGARWKILQRERRQPRRILRDFWQMVMRIWNWRGGAED